MKGHLLTVALSGFLLASLALTVPVEGQPTSPTGGGISNGEVTGQVVESSSGRAIPTATVALWRETDSTLVTGAVANERGHFQLEGIRPGLYYLSVSFVGFETEHISGIALQPPRMQYSVGTVEMSPSTALLDEVQVNAEREFMEVRIDRTVYNTRDQIVADGGSATDVLRNIPALEVDIDGNVSLRGNQNIAILINGRPSNMSGDMLAAFLQGLPASSIDRVEVIPNPSARYDPDGMSGIVNIVLKKDVSLGIGGSVSAGANSIGEANASGMLSYHKGKTSARLNYGFRSGSRERSGERFNEYRFSNPFEYLATSSTSDNRMLSHTINGNVDFQIRPRTLLSFSGLLGTRSADGDDLNRYSSWIADINAAQRYDRFAEQTSSDLNADASVTLAHVVEPSRNEWTAELRWSSEQDDEDQEFRQIRALEPEPFLEEHERTTLGEGSRTLRGEFDYVRPLGEKGLWEVGYMGEWEQLDTDIFSEALVLETNTFEPLQEVENEFVYERQIHAVYGMVQQQFGKFGVQLGSRLEQAITDFSLSATDEAFDNDYLSLFPSAFGTYQLNDRNLFRLSYSKRINRPRVSGWHNQLNPIYERSDPLFRRQGNPYLKPEYTHAFELTYSLTTAAATFSMSPYYRRTVDVIRSISDVNESGVTTVTFQNLDESDAWGLESIASMRLGERFNGFASVEVFRVNTDAGTLESALNNQAYGWSTRVNGTLRITPTLSMQAFLFYRAPMDVEQGRMGAMTWSNIAFRQQLFGNRASLSLRIEDPFDTAGFSMWREAPTYYFDFENSWQSRALNVSFTYNFGQQDRNNNRRRPQMEERGEEMDDMGF